MPRDSPNAVISSSAISVIVHPGHTTLARSPAWAWSTASDWVSMVSPALVTAYPPIPLAARSAAIDATETIAPRRASRCGSAALATEKAPVRLTATIASQSASDRSATPPGSMTPAFSTSPSSPPNRSATEPTATATCAGSLTSHTTSTAPVCAATAASTPARRPKMATRSPPAVRDRVTAAPMPVPPPVTMTARGELTRCSWSGRRAGCSPTWGSGRPRSRRSRSRARPGRTTARGSSGWSPCRTTRRSRRP